MTTTTKIFIILVCLFAFIFTPMAIQFAARTNNWRQLAETWRDQSETDAAHARSIEAIAASQLAQAEALRAQEQARLVEANHRIDQLTQEIATLAGDRDKLALSVSSMENAGKLQSATMAILARHHDEMTKSNRQLTGRELDLQTRNAQLSDRVKELSAEQVVLRQQLNQRTQEVSSCRDENETLRRQQGLGRAGEFASAGPSPSARAETPAARGPVQGQVKNVQGNLATINVGSSSGIREGMTMVVVREGDYICDLVITSEVTPTEAVGEIRREQGKRIRPGDTVMDEASFNARG